jgi:hypothetical protein
LVGGDFGGYQVIVPQDEVTMLEFRVRRRNNFVVGSRYRETLQGDLL